MMGKFKEICLNIDFNCGLIRLSNVLLELIGKIVQIDLKELNSRSLICDWGIIERIHWHFILISLSLLNPLGY